MKITAPILTYFYIYVKFYYQNSKRKYSLKITLALFGRKALFIRPACTCCSDQIPFTGRKLKMSKAATLFYNFEYRNRQPYLRIERCPTDFRPCVSP